MAAICLQISVLLKTRQKLKMRYTKFNLKSRDRSLQRVTDRVLCEVQTVAVAFSL